MKKIIIIEDSNLLRLQMKNILEKNGFTTIGLNSAEHIYNNLDFFLKDVSLIMLDIRMPGISGIELAKLISSNACYNDIPIVFVSSCRDAKVVNEALKAGGVDYILKPFTEEILMGRVISLLGNPLMDEFNQIHISKEKADTTIRNEYDRAIRGKQVISFFIIETTKENLEPLVEKLKGVLRQIDMVYIVNSEIFIILPLTNEAGMHVVANKINNLLIENRPEFNLRNKVHFNPENDKSIEELIGDIFLGSKMLQN